MLLGMLLSYHLKLLAFSLISHFSEYRVSSVLPWFVPLHLVVTRLLLDVELAFWNSFLWLLRWQSKALFIQNLLLIIPLQIRARLSLIELKSQFSIFILLNILFRSYFILNCLKSRLFRFCCFLFRWCFFAFLGHFLLFFFYFFRKRSVGVLGGYFELFRKHRPHFLKILSFGSLHFKTILLLLTSSSQRPSITHQSSRWSFRAFLLIEKAFHRSVLRQSDCCVWRSRSGCESLRCHWLPSWVLEVSCACHWSWSRRAELTECCLSCLGSFFLITLFTLNTTLPVTLSLWSEPGLRLNSLGYLRSTS